MAARSARPKLIAIVGPTASGKSELAMKIARQFDGEIIAADSRTIYKGMDIGTAKPTRQDQALVPHHLLDLASPDQPFSVGVFKKLADKAISNIRARGKLPILVGGTGLYIDSVLFDYKFNQGGERDPVNPRHKLVRGADSLSSPVSGAIIIGLNPNKLELESRIRARANRLVQAGFLEEVKRLARRYPSDLEVFKTPGYKSFLSHLAGNIDLPAALELFVLGDIQLAKKQRTWFKRNKHIVWFDNVPAAQQYVADKLASNK